MNIETLKTLYASAVVVGKAGAVMLGSLSALCTLLAHLPKVPVRAQQFFARVGLATSRFSVNKRPLEEVVK